MIMLWSWVTTTGEWNRDRWNRVNANSNFFANGHKHPYGYLFVKDMVQFDIKL